MSITSRPLSPFGAEVLGLDLTRPLTEAEAAEVRAIWIQAGILLVRGGTSSEALINLSQCFGELQPAATKKLNSVEDPRIMWLQTDPKKANSDTLNLVEVGGEVRAGWLGWHWDQAFMPEIVRGAVLRMVEPASVAGETGFIDAIGAYDRLPDAMKARIEGLEVVYHFNGAQEQNRFGYPKDIKLVRRSPEAAASIENYKKEFPPTVHPLVITQRETGRKVLKLSPMHVQYILGMEREESDALLEELANHLVDPRYAYHHKWQADEMVVWDNWRIIHSAAGVPPEVTRRAQRTTIVGDYKLGRYLDPTIDRSKQTASFMD